MYTPTILYYIACLVPQALPRVHEVRDRWVCGRGGGGRAIGAGDRR